MKPDEVREALDDLVSAVDYIRWGASSMSRGGVYCGHGYADPLDESLALVLHVLGLPHGTPDALLAGRLTRREREQIVNLLSRRTGERIPLAYLLGEAWFAGRPFFTDSRALVPRSPFAEMVEKQFAPWVEAESVSRIVELGTGGGAIAVAAALAFPWAEVHAVDICPDALELARSNVERYDLEERVFLHRGDLFEPLAGARFDLVIANPPYVPDIDVDAAPPEFHHEPRLGLAAGEDGMDIVRRIVVDAGAHLFDDGVLMVEVGASWPQIEHEFADLGFAWAELEHGGDGIFVVESDALSLFSGEDR